MHAVRRVGVLLELNCEPTSSPAVTGSDLALGLLPSRRVPEVEYINPGCSTKRWWSVSVSRLRGLLSKPENIREDCLGRIDKMVNERRRRGLLKDATSR